MHALQVYQDELTTVRNHNVRRLQVTLTKTAVMEPPKDASEPPKDLHRSPKGALGHELRQAKAWNRAHDEPAASAPLWTGALDESEGAAGRQLARLEFEAKGQGAAEAIASYRPQALQAARFAVLDE
ncbi:MAG: hypothetical protein ACJAZ8_000782 [Planctomycetota bacterium]|jgi:hypothetical protein